MNIKFKKILVLVVGCVLLGIFATGCETSGNYHTATPISITEATKVATVTVSLTPSPQILDLGYGQNTLIFTCDDGIYQYDVRDKEFSSLTKDLARIYRNADIIGDKIYFLRSTDQRPKKLPAGGQFGPTDIFRMDMDGSHLEQITNDEFDDFNLSAHSSTKRLVFVSDRPTGNDRYKVVLLNLENGEQKIIAESRNQFLPLWSPNGNKVALVEISVSSGVPLHLYVFNMDDGKLNDLKLGIDIVSRRLAWSPDGRYIVLGTVSANEHSITIVDVEAQNIYKQIFFDDLPISFAWSPDGKKIAFDTKSDIGLKKLWLLNVDDEKSVALTTGDSSSQLLSFNEIWPQDSQYLAYFNHPGPDDLILNIQNVRSLQDFTVKVSCPYVNSVFWAELP